MNNFSIVIPVYNEEKSIKDTIDSLFKNLAILPRGCTYEIIAVDDGSTDGTSKILASIGTIKTITFPRNRGYGAALKAGVAEAITDTIVITDADGTYPVEEIPTLVRIYSEGSHHMVVGARVGKNAKIPLVRKPAKRFLTNLANYLSATEIPDLNSGLRVMNKDIVTRYLSFLPDGFSFTSTITLIMLSNGYSVKYIPIEYFKREGTSKIRPIPDFLNFIKLIIRTILYFDPLKIFFPASLLLAFSAFVVLFGSWYFLGKPMDVTFGIILMTSIVILAIGMLADLINKRLR